tara:strand:- start:229 stop:774 length:546 start_codon:yes stop_codon:yes gene_type:complete
MKILVTFFLYFLLIFNSFANDRESELNKLFNELKTNDLSSAYEIEQKIWNIWTTHPNDPNISNLLTIGTNLMSQDKLFEAKIIFSDIIKLDPSWAEAWNKRATVLYLLGSYKESQMDIDKVLQLEKRHFGALSGQGLVQIKLKNYEKALKSYKKVEIIYPSMRSPKVMIPKIIELINKSTI